MIKEGLQQPTIPVRPDVFEEYARANTIMPQVSDGIKWFTHDLMLGGPTIDLSAITMSAFSQEQLATLRTRSNAAHRAFRVSAVAVDEGEQVPPATTPVYDRDNQGLWGRVKHSLVNNLHFYQRLTTGEDTLETIGYKNDLENDLRQPSMAMIAEATRFAREDNSAMEAYRAGLKMIRQASDSKEGKAVLRQYREEFRRGKRTSIVWRQEGHGDRFAAVVKDVMTESGIDSRDQHMRHFLFLNNLSDYTAFSNK